MTPSTAERIFRELCDAHAGVSRLDLDAGAARPLLSLAARDDSGRPTAAAVVRGSDVLTAEQAVEVLGRARRRALVTAEQATEHLFAGLELRVRAGEDLNIAAIARETGLSRQTVYTRLEAARHAPSAA